MHAEDIAANQAMAATARLSCGQRRRAHPLQRRRSSTCGYGTALGVIRRPSSKAESTFYADETRPFLQGSRLTAWELMKDGIPTTVISDNMAGP